MGNKKLKINKFKKLKIFFFMFKTSEIFRIKKLSIRANFQKLLRGKNYNKFLNFNKKILYFFKRILFF
jgi:hypothetical protein